MTEPKGSQIPFRDEEGDELLRPFELRLWAICLSARPTFNADLIFTHRTYEDDLCLRFFVEQDQFGSLVKTMEKQMTVEYQIRCRDDDGDQLISHLTVLLWAICRAARETVNAEVIFDHSTDGDNYHIRFFLPRDHPGFSYLQTHIKRIFEPSHQASSAEISQEMDSWREHVFVDIYPYSGVPGVMAFMDAQREVMEAAEKHHHPEPDRVAEIALEEGRRAAQMVSATLRGSS
jgi:hypothetical protein